MSDGLHVTYRRRPDATPENEAAALAAVYKFLFERHAYKDTEYRSTQSHTRKEVSADERLKK
jgi:hypothetical protein